MEQVREETFEKMERLELESYVKSLEYDNAELVKKNEELSARVKQLATRHPQWPSGYKPRRHTKPR